jgi:hypothetical protein
MMSWQRRLMELACAGGTLAGCMASSNQQQMIPCGNANPDPCICNRTPDPEHSPQCIAEKICTDNGGDWIIVDPPPAGDAGGELWGFCNGYPKDAGVDGPHIDSSVPGE